MAHTHHNIAASAGISDWVHTAIENLRTALARRRVFVKTLNELNGLSQRDLNDLGIHRSMIRRLAHEAAYGK